MKYLVIDAGGQHFRFDAERMESELPEQGGPRTVRFYDGDNLVAEYSSPTSVGPAPDLIAGVDEPEAKPKKKSN